MASAFENRNPILYRYITREIFAPFAVTLCVFTGILFLVRSLKLVELIISRNVPVVKIVLLFSYIIPKFLELAIPMSLLFGIIYAFSRFSNDSELIVMRANGISFKQLCRPVLVFSAACALVTLVIGFWIRPWANYKLAAGVFEIAKLQASSGLVPGVFNDLGQLTLYAERVNSKTGQLTNVIIGDSSNPELPREFISERGRIVSNDETRTIQFRLYDGSIHEGKRDKYTVTYFPISNISLNQDGLTEETEGQSGKKSNEKPVEELLASITEYENKPQPLGLEDLLQLARYKVEFHRRIVLALSCVCIALLGMALGVQPSRVGQSWGAAISITIGIFAIIVYYLLLAFATAVAEQAFLPAWAVIWLPDIIFAALAIYVFRGIESERWLGVSVALANGLSKIGTKLNFIARNNANKTPVTSG